jgi:hypothetical protein
MCAQAHLDTRPATARARLVPFGFVLALLAACGGGGGGGDPQPAPAPPPPPANAAPTIGGSPALIAEAGTEYSFKPVASDTNGDALTFEIENAPPWATFDAATGEIRGTPFAGSLGQYADIVIRVSDGKASAALPAFSLTVLAQQLGEANFKPEGQVTATAEGYRSVGDLVMDTGERELRFEDADLTLAFDSDGKLVDFEGETFLPQHPADGVTIDSPVRAVVGMMSGAEINADEAFGIQLQPQTSYLVFFLSVGVDITFGDPASGALEHLTLETPAAGQILIIADPTDPFFYRFGSQPLLGEYGRGESAHGLIPYIPLLPHPELDTFSGHEIEKGAFGVGVKVFDFFELAGTRVTRNPQFADIDWQDPFESAIEFKAGLNGLANFDFAILSVGLFSFELAQTSATLDVGFDRQSMAMQTRVAPDVSWVPPWFPFVPTTEVVGDWFVNGDGEFRASLSGTYTSTVPPADIMGTMSISSDEGTVLSGTTSDDEDSFTVSAQFENDVTTVSVEFTEDFAAGIGTAVTGALDRELAAAEEALADLEAAISDYEFELSLRGLRSVLPAISDAAVAVLNGLPNTVRNAADTATVNYINNACVTVIVEVCLSTLVDEAAIGDAVGATARARTVTEVAPYVTALQHLKTQAQSADDEALRETLRQALLTVHANQVFSRRIVVSHTFPSPFGTVTVFDQTITRRIISEADAAAILTAANNVYRIAETSDIMISAQAIFDAFPAEQVLSTVRQEVADGVAAIPTVEALGATIAGGVVTPFVRIDGENHPVAFNVLKPAEALAGIGDLVAELLVAGAEE